jgi:hypothetical protein
MQVPFTAALQRRGTQSGYRARAHTAAARSDDEDFSSRTRIDSGAGYVKH